ncbi:MAG: ECF transporter S component, partial [Longicatena sp.]
MSGNWTSLLIAFVPRILLGFLAGWMFEILQKKKVNDHVSVVAGALTGAITNTVLVLLGIYVFFGAPYAQAVGISYTALVGVLLGVVTTNGIAEAILGALSALLVCNALKPFMKKYKR